MIIDFFINHGFILELLLASTLFLFSLKRRRFFILRLFIYLAVFCTVAIAWDFVFGKSIISQIIKFTTLFIFRVCGDIFCFDINIWVAIFCETGAFATAHFMYKIATLWFRLFAKYIAIYTLMYFISFVSVYAASYFLFASKIKRNEAKYLENKQIILLCIALIIFTTTFELVTELYLDIMPIQLILVVVFYDLFCCIFTLCIQFGMFKSGKLQEDYNVMEHVFHLQKQQLQMSKENIDMINLKCHDLKHHISRLGDRIGKEELDELKNIISIYDSSLKTENQALDVILAEKSLYCERNNIKLHCIADGECLAFMNSSDIYSLFGNIIDNAVEAVGKVDDTTKRIISISVKKSMNMISVHSENYFLGQLFIEQGLPITTKNDKAYHGYGMKSIKILVEKYKGDFTFHVANNKFNLNLIFPEVEKESKE